MANTKQKLTVDTQEKMRNKSKCTTKESHLPTWAESSKKKKKKEEEEVEEVNRGTPMQPEN